MKIFTNQKIKGLFIRILSCILLFVLLSAALMVWGLKERAFYILFCAVCMGIAILFFCYGYFKEQNRIMEEAAGQVRQYISGDRSARIECNEEGELYRLFYEVNSLAATLNAQAEKEGRMRKFLKNTISDISHQLKTPLAALNIYNGIIQAEALEQEAQDIKEFSDLSERELDRIETLVQNLLKIARFDAGTVVIEGKPENISEMMADVKKHFLYRAKEEGKEIVLKGNEALSFFCDKSWIVEAVGNIVKNALDHTERGQYVRIEWGQSVSAVWITIKDNGRGIREEDLYHIFKRFYRSRYSKDTQGIGLGLPLAKTIVEAHNGTIEVDSRQGDGTSFAINFLIPTKL